MNDGREVSDREGRCYRLRPIEPADAPALRRAYHELSPEDRRARLLAPAAELGFGAARRFCTIDPAVGVCLVLESSEAPGELLGGLRLMGDGRGDDAEFSVSLRSELKRRGLGRVLMNEIQRLAVERGWRVVWGSILAENVAMIALAKRLGFDIARDPDDWQLVEAVWHVPRT